MTEPYYSDEHFCEIVARRLAQGAFEFAPTP